MPSHRQTLRALKRLRRVYKVARDQAAAELAAADVAVSTATQQLTQAQGQHEAAAEDFPRRARGARLAAHFDFIDAERQCTEANIATAQQHAREAEDLRHEHAGRVAAAERRLALADRVHQRTVAALQHAADRAEQATIDDLAPTRIKDDR